MENGDELEYIVIKHGPTTSILASRDGMAPSRKEKTVLVRVSNLAPISPYVIRVTNEQPAKRVTRTPRAAHHVSVNFLAPQLLWRKKFVESDGTLSFTEDDLAELLEEEVSGPVADVFVSRKHPFRLRAVVMFSLAALLVVLPMRAFSTKDELLQTKSDIVSESKLGVAALREAAASLSAKSPEAAVRAFERAEFAFSRAASMSDMNQALRSLASLVPQGRQAVSGNKSLLAVQALSSGAARVSLAFADLEKEATLTGKLARMEEAFAGLESDFRVASSALANVSSADLPADIPVDSLRLMISDLQSQLPSLRSAMTLLGSMLGEEAPQRYLVLFQNSNELRPTGGFVGSFALLDVKKGMITNLEIPGDGSYNLQGRLTKFVSAPEPLRILNPRWEFQDTNWYMDFPRSARIASEFYAKAGGPSVDGVIAVNSKMMEKLLAVTGPIEIPGTKETVDSKNFVDTAQRLAQFDYDKTLNQPKAFLGQLAPKLLEVIASGDADKLMQLSEVFSGGLHSKDLQVWARNEERAKVLRSFGWDGAQLPADSDYVAFVNANIAGGKTDGVIAEHLLDRTTIQPDGRVLKTVEVTRKHNGVADDIFTGDTNVTYHRLYVPRGAKLLSVSGSVAPDASRFGSDLSLKTDADAAETMQYTVFSAWSELKPGESVTIRFSYELPALPEGALASLSTVYDMQSGTARTLRHTIAFPPSWDMVWHDEKLSGSGSNLSMEQDFSHSTVSSVLFKR